MNLLEQINAEQMAKLSALRPIPEFQPGDTVVVNVKVKEGERTRVQAYEGVCIARSGAGLNQSFTVRKISYGEGVERVFPLFSPNIDSIKVERRGKVRRAKLYYLRDRRGKSARIAERMNAVGAPGKAAGLMSGAPDDISLIAGIGPVYDKKLHELGITSFKQIAGLTPAAIKDLETKLNIGEKIEHENWVAQAKELMAGQAPRAKTDQAKKAGDKLPKRPIKKK